MANHDYSDGEVQEILKRAAAIDGNRDFSRHVLEQTAAELGISREAVEQATADFESHRKQNNELEAFLAYRRASFHRHLASYVVTNLFMVGIWFMTGSRYPWFIWVILGWGMGIASHAITAYSRTGPDFDREFKQWRKSRSKQLPY